MSSITIAEVHMDYNAFMQAYLHARKNTPYEIGGFLMGYVGKWQGRYYLMISKVVPVQSKSTAVTVEFLNKGIAETVAEINKIRQESGHYVVGWYHSHPGYTCTPSRLDLRSHVVYFREPYQVGLIVDPVNDEHCVFDTDNIFNYRLIPFYVWRRLK